MYTLAIDTSAKTSSAALVRDGEIAGSFKVSCGLTHSETMLHMIDSLIKACSIDIGDIDVLSCCAGPGSFTGVRIGVSLIKGLAFADQRPCAGVSSLMSMAYGFYGCGLKAIISPVIDARRETVYNALFSLDGGEIVRLTEDRVVTARELENEILREYADVPVFFPGDGAYLISDKIKAALPKEACIPSACGAAFIAERMFRAGECVSASALAPIYLRPARADVPKSLRNTE